MNGRETPKQTNLVTEQTDGRKCRQTLAALAAKSTLSSNGNNAKSNVD